ncbi:MAG: DUF423 domain-containing protein [Wenzhouxiangella sp.]|jgi:uncharacterized membrane protein YgdD (TMEM256/DUF423 family)|nr:DUF423 domain-containing protein [Wenzhouxiangella sp.]
MNPVLIVGALLGLLSVAIGASAEHLIRQNVEPEIWRWVMTAVRYHQIGAVVVTAVGLALAAGVGSAHRFILSAGFLIAGTVLFSFSIYAAALTGIEKLTYLTPLGGVSLMFGWLLLIWAGFGANRE